MTIWDDIYKNKKKESGAWATPSDRFYPLFRRFLSRSNFEKKHVLDIGCGVGKYLQILQGEGFTTDGIDSSETAVEMTTKLLGNDSDIVCADMFEYELPENRYDLVISILTIHHGTKRQVKDLVGRIYEGIADDRKIFITTPDLESSKKWDSFRNHKEVAEGTFISLSGPEKGLSHSFYAEEEIRKLFSGFKDLTLDMDDQGNWIVQASK